MPPFDIHPVLGHPEVAAWALGALDQPDAEAFREHLASCSECPAAVAEFESVARALEYQVPDAEPQSELEARTIAAVQYAAMTAS
jgi:anti-sigma factor RsiW